MDPICTADGADGVALTRQHEVDHTGQEPIFPRRSGSRTVLGIGDMFDVRTFRLYHRNRTSFPERCITFQCRTQKKKNTLDHSRAGL